MTKNILFQGDSITDALRDRENFSNAGCGYATMIEGELGLKHPEKYKFLNRGIAGNRIADMYARLEKDVINLKPDYMSILIGSNDAWQEINYNTGASPEKYEKLYCMFLEETKEALPDIKIMILEPFVLKGAGPVKTDEQEDLYPLFRKAIEKRAEAAYRVAERFSLPFVELQAKFDSAYNPENPTYWLKDGVHPTAAGHALIAREWLNGFEKLNEN